jgi:putative PEP-CTERM system histidine kinase
MQAADALLEARKFDAFNRMSAFVVHDLKNIVSQLSLMLINAQRHKDNAEFQQDMLMTVSHSVDRMKQMMMQLRDGTTPVEPAAPVDVAEVVRRIQSVKQTQQPRPQFLLDKRLFTKGHADRIERVIGHVVQNAIDATEDTGEVRVALLREGAHVVVEVRDSGCGMPPEFARERLFKPFQTTKQGGMGIGAYESYQYVHELGGDIHVESEVGRGTTMRILMPLYEGGSTPAVADKALA